MDARNELVFHNVTVSLPIFPVFDRTPSNKSIEVLDDHPIYSPLKVTPTPMYQYGDEKHGVEVRNYGCRSNDCTPGKTHSPVGNIIRLARISPPTTREQTISARLVSI